MRKNKTNSFRRLCSILTRNFLIKLKEIKCFFEVWAWVLLASLKKRSCLLLKIISIINLLLQLKQEGFLLLDINHRIMRTRVTNRIIIDITSYLIRILTIYKRGKFKIRPDLHKINIMILEIRSLRLKKVPLHPLHQKHSNKRKLNKLMI